VTVDFSQFGAASPVTAVQTPAGSNLWTASYVIVAGTIDGRVGNVSVTATNDVGSTTTADTTNATVDNVAPAVQITAVTPDPRDALVDEVTVAFSEPILGLDLADLSLTRDGGADLLTGSETLSTVDNITWTLGGLAAHTASGAGGPGGFAAFNDHAPAAGATHANATTYATNGTPSGTLKDIASGGAVGAMLTVTQAGANLASGSTNPASGTPAYQMFHGFVDFSGVTGASIELEAVNNDYYLHTFSALDTGSAATYNFHGTAVRGNSSYTRRWTKVTLVGAASAAPDHTPGNGVLVLSNTEVALWTGYNSAASQGFVAGWKDIDPGPDGQFAVRSEQYTGAIPAAIDAGGWANDVKGYALAGVRLEAVVPSEPIPGEYVLALQAAGAGIQDAAGNPLAAGASETFTIDTQPPTAAIGPVAPDPRITPVETVAITFDEPVTGFDLTDLALTRDGGANLLTGEQTLTTADSRTWTLGNLGGLTTARGSYGLVLTAAGSGIQDLLGHALTGDASESWLTAPGYVLGTGGKDVIRIVCNAFGAAKVDVFVNNDSVPCDTVIRTDVPSWLVAGGEGDDELTVDFTRGSPLPPGPAVGLLFDGASGSDVLHVVDPSGDGAVATATQVIVGDAAHVGFSNVEGCRFELGAGKLTKIGDGVLVLAGNSRYSGATEVLCGTLVVSSADSLPAGGNLTIGSDGTVVLSSGLNVGGAGVAAPSLASPALATPVPDALTANIEQAGGTSSSANSPAAPTLTAAPVQRAGPVAMTMQFQPVIDTMTARSVPFATAGGKAVVSQLPSAAKAAAATESAARPVPAPPTQIKARDAVLQTLTLQSRSGFSWVWALEESWSRKQFPKKNAVALSAVDQALCSLSP
jgi:autotransporter-associated beta strand protein